MDGVDDSLFLYFSGVIYLYEFYIEKLLNVSTNLQLIVIGLIIIFAVTADQIAVKRRN